MQLENLQNFKEPHNSSNKNFIFGYLQKDNIKPTEFTSLFIDYLSMEHPVLILMPTFIFHMKMWLCKPPLRASLQT